MAFIGTGFTTSTPQSTKANSRAHAKTSLKDDPIRHANFNKNAYSRTRRARGKASPGKALAELERALQTDPSFSIDLRGKSFELIAQLKHLLNRHNRDIQPKGTPIASEVGAELAASTFGSTESMTSPISTVRFTPTVTTFDSGYQTQPAISMPLEPLTSLPSISSSASDYKRARRLGRTGPSNLVYQCTYPDCGEVFPSKCDWKRHEESEMHWPQRRFMCLECTVSIRDPDGIPLCTSCWSPFEDDNAVKMYNLQCASAQEFGTTFVRKDHLRSHLRTKHDMLNLPSQAEAWTYDLMSAWPRECGFCGIRLSTWNERVNHLEEDFKKGFTMASWRIPFRSSMDNYDVLESPRYQDGDDDDDYEDKSFRKENYDSTFQVISNPKTATTSTLDPQRQANPTSSSKRQCKKVYRTPPEDNRSLDSIEDTDTIRTWNQSLCLRTSDSYSSARHRNLQGPDIKTLKASEFEHLKRLTRGSYGTVDEILYKPTLQVMVRKTIHQNSKSRDTEVSRELEILKKLRSSPHRHIVELVGSYFSKDKLCVLMLPVADFNLRTFMHEVVWKHPGILDSRSTILWFGCLSSAVEFLHSHQIVHKDIKPSNILIHGSEVVLTDFGIAHSLAEPKLPEEDYCCTPQYCAPEVALRGQVRTEADLFSLGCVFAELVTIMAGRSVDDLRASLNDDPVSRPYHLNIPSVRLWLEWSIIRKIAEIQPVLKSDVQMIIKMLDAIPERRPTARSLMHHFAPIGCCSQLSQKSQQMANECLSAFDDFTIQATQPNTGAREPAANRSEGTHRLEQANLKDVPSGSKPLKVYLADCQRLEACYAGLPLNMNETLYNRLLERAIAWGHQVSEDADLMARPPEGLQAGSLCRNFPRSLHQHSEPSTFPSKFSMSTVIQSDSSATSIASSQRLCDVPRKAAVTTTNATRNTSEQSQKKFGYELQCEFCFMGCEIRYGPSCIEEWISHTQSHLHDSPPPSNAGCIFCHENLNTPESESKKDPWRQRMLHIAEHFKEGASEDDLVPDYTLVIYLKDRGLITDEDYSNAIKYQGIPGINAPAEEISTLQGRKQWKRDRSPSLDKTLPYLHPVIENLKMEEMGRD